MLEFTVALLYLWPLIKTVFWLLCAIATLLYLIGVRRKLITVVVFIGATCAMVAVVRWLLLLAV